jgi:hypothetical protein
MLWRLRSCLFLAPARRLLSTATPVASLERAVTDFNDEMASVFGAQQQPQRGDGAGSLQDAYRLTQELHAQQAGLAPRPPEPDEQPLPPPPPPSVPAQGRAITINIHVPPGQGSAPLHVNLSVTLRVE